MLSFRLRNGTSRAGTKNYLSHSFQRRYIWALMGLAMLVMLFAPSFKGAAGKQASTTDGHVTDNKIEKSEPSAQPDKLIMPGQLKVPEAKPMLPIDGKRLFGGVSSKLFEGLQDDSSYRTAENATFFKLLKTMIDADERDIEQASIGRLSFVQLYEQSHEYRGEIVTIGGTVERVLPQTDPPANDQGIKKLYEVWIRPDGGRMPIVAIVANLPEDYAGGRPEVDISGFFYKRLGYASQEAASGAQVERGMKNVYRSSPLVLAQTLRVRPAPPAAAAPPAEGPEALRGVPLPIPAKYVMPALGLGMLLMCVLAGWAFKLSRTSAMSRGPIVGRGSTSGSAAEADVRDLNSLHVEP